MTRLSPSVRTVTVVMTVALVTLFISLDLRADDYTEETSEVSILEVNPERTLRIFGEVNSGIISKANTILDMSEKSKDPIYLVINSPGGSVIAGLQVISAMRIVRHRGVTIKCVVPMMAASMAFQIFAECDERYAFDNSLLLWHPIRVFMQGPLTPKEAKDIARMMELYEKHMVDVLLDRLDISREVFDYHYYSETLHLGIGLKEIAPGFLTLIKDVRGIRIPFSMAR